MALLALVLAANTLSLVIKIPDNDCIHLLRRSRCWGSRGVRRGGPLSEATRFSFRHGRRPCSWSRILLRGSGPASSLVMRQAKSRQVPYCLANRSRTGCGTASLDLLFPHAHEGINCLSQIRSSKTAYTLRAYRKEVLPQTIWCGTRMVPVQLDLNSIRYIWLNYRCTDEPQQLLNPKSWVGCCDQRLLSSRAFYRGVSFGQNWTEKDAMSWLYSPSDSWICSWWSWDTNSKRVSAVHCSLRHLSHPRRSRAWKVGAGNPCCDTEF